MLGRSRPYREELKEMKEIVYTEKLTQEREENMYVRVR